MMLVAAITQPLVNTFIALLALAGGFVTFLFSVRQAKRIETRAADNARSEAETKATQLQVVGIGEVQAALDQVDFWLRSTRHVLHDLAAEMSRALDNGHRLDEIVHRVEEPMPEIRRLRDPLHYPPPRADLS